MRISSIPTDPGYVNATVPGRGHIVDITLDGVVYRHVQTADEEAGFIDTYCNTIVGGTLAEGFQFNTPERLVHRLWGKVRIIRKNYLTDPDA